MIRDLERDSAEDAPRTDVCIVGAGAAGIVLALELLRLGKTVTILEGGGADIEEPSQEPYRSEIAGRPHNGIHEGRFRANGGTTNKWGGQILELDELDFAKRDWVPGSGWPISKSELQPCYASALEYEGLTGVMRQDSDIWTALHVDRPSFPALDAYFSRWCPEPKFAVLHREALAGNPNLTVWLHCNAVELELADEQAVGVRCRTLAGKQATFHAREYVFCLGAIECARFFLQPRAGQLPWNRSGLLGKHFQDHVDSNGATVVPVRQQRFHDLFDNVFYGGYKYHPKVRFTHEAQRELRTLNAAATMYFVSDVDEALMGLKSTAKRLLRGRLGEVQGKEALQLLTNLPLLLRQAYRYSVQHRAYNPAAGKIMLRVHCEQEPLSASSIDLADTRDSLGLLRTRLNWKISPTELATIRSYVETAQKSLSGIATIIPDAALMAGDPAYLAQCVDSSHHMGGMRMAASEQDGVVDTDLKLFGTRNAYVCSGGVFPTSGYSNPTHTVLALAVRLARHLAQ